MSQNGAVFHAPEELYARRLEERRAEIATREARHRKLGYLRLACVAAGLAVVALALTSQVFSIAWAVIPAAAFVALLVAHERLLRKLERRRRSLRFYEKGLGRLKGQWPGTGETGARYLDAAHPYAEDLDLFGTGSLFELLSTARTHVGEQTLASWLLAPAPPATVLARQAAVRELTPRLDLREDLAVTAEEARTGLDPVSLAAWGEAPVVVGGSRWYAGIVALTALGMAGGAGLFALGLAEMKLIPLSATAATLLRDMFLFVLVVNGVARYRVNGPVERVVGAVEAAAHELGLLSEVLVRLERERFQSPLLAELRASLDTGAWPPSQRIARLNRLMELLDSRDNVFVRMAEPFLFWTPHLAFAVEAWRRHSGQTVRRWLEATGEIEALCSLASYSFEHPADPFPEFSGEAACWEAEGVAHPLIPEERAVRNDVRIGGDLRVVVVSGSNMSGKSTLLRTIGVNTVLAQAGAAVRARRLRLSPLAVGASIRVVDSLQTGTSRFYAEILRLRQILDATVKPLPVLFLIDEFLHGTNSHDRRIGAGAVVRGLADRGAIGFITTHDLALADIADELGARAANVHFEDSLVEGRMSFDYVMRPGVVRKSNALELMRSVGLEI